MYYIYVYVLIHLIEKAQSNNCLNKLILEAMLFLKQA